VEKHIQREVGLLMIKSAEDEFFENFHLYIRAYFPADLDKDKNNMLKEKEEL